MYRFVFHYENGKELKFENIERITCSSDNTVQELRGNQILNCSFKFNCDYSLFSKTSTFAVPAKNLLFIEATEM